ncbi:unnamed protein product, partial [Amoebophrya sp. A120]
AGRRTGGSRRSSALFAASFFAGLIGNPDNNSLVSASSTTEQPTQLFVFGASSSSAGAGGTATASTNPTRRRTNYNDKNDRSRSQTRSSSRNR